jgi:hypothetical protein
LFNCSGFRQQLADPRVHRPGAEGRANFPERFDDRDEIYYGTAKVLGEELVDVWKELKEELGNPCSNQLQSKLNLNSPQTLRKLQIFVKLKTDGSLFICVNAK